MTVNTGSLQEGKVQKMGKILSYLYWFGCYWFEFDYLFIKKEDPICLNKSITTDVVF